LCWLAALNTAPVKAQTPRQGASLDSLEMNIIMAADSLKPAMLLALSDIYLQVDPEKALERANKALIIARANQDALQEGRALRALALALQYHLYDYKSALNSALEALALQQEKGLVLEQALTLGSIASIYQEIQDYPKQVNYLQQSLVLFDSLRRPGYMAVTKRQLGMAMVQAGNNARGVEYLQEAKGFFEQRQEMLALAQTHENLGQAQVLRNAFALAANSYNAALQIADSLVFRPQMATLRFALSHCARNLGQYTNAVAWAEQGLQVATNWQDTLLLAQGNQQLARVLMDQKKYTRAINLLGKALNAAQVSQDKRLMLQSYDWLYTCHAAMGNYKKALQFQERYVQMNAFINNEDDRRQVVSLEAAFEAARRNSQIDSLAQAATIQSLELNAAQKQRNYWGISAVLAVIIIVLLAIILVNRHRSGKATEAQNVELTQLNATKDRFFSIIAHDLKGPLNTLSSFSSLLINHFEHLSAEEIKGLAADTEKSIKNLMALLENLLTWARSQTGVLEFKPEKLDLGQVVQSNVDLLKQTAEKKEITLACQIDADLYVWADANSVNTVLRNLISNALKYTRAGGKVSVRASEWKDAAEIAVADTGIGMEPKTMKGLFTIENKTSLKGTANETGTGLGLILCKDFVEKNHGTMHVHSVIDQGSTFSFTLPAYNEQQSAENGT